MRMTQNNRHGWHTFEEMRSAADEGEPSAQCALGICFQNGQGVKQDYQEAVKWFRRAADQNDSTGTTTGPREESVAAKE